MFKIGHLLLNLQLDANQDRHLAFFRGDILQDKDILEKAQELLDENSQIPPLNLNRTGSYDEETKFVEDSRLESKENVERKVSAGESFNIPEQGYQRFPRYKKPGLLKFIGGIGIIIILIVLMSMLMPYIPRNG